MNILNADILNADILNDDILNDDILNDDLLNDDILTDDILNDDNDDQCTIICVTFGFHKPIVYILFTFYYFFLYIIG